MDSEVTSFAAEQVANGKFNVSGRDIDSGVTSFAAERFANGKLNGGRMTELRKIKTVLIHHH